MARSHRARRTGVWHLGTVVGNSWLLVDDDGVRVLVDSGHRAERALVVAGLARFGIVRSGDLDVVLLTHRHCDHAGNAAWLRERFDCAVACHAADRGALEGAVRAARLAGRGAPPVYEALCRVEDSFPARAVVDHTFVEGEGQHGFEVVHVGGHTEGSVLLYHQPSATLFTGDALVTGPPVQRMVVRPRLAYRSFSDDADACRANTVRYLRSRPRIARVCGGHGPMITNDVERWLERIVGARAG
ncbi:MAG: MBL fold metallo-hydrolase [Deltaproteobacteria bacterium]|nr:MBL fold metallo-hydrolase [Deltaproteobacteria bacterium]